MPFYPRAKTATRADYITTACASIVAALEAHAAHNDSEQYRNLDNAVDDLCSAGEQHLAARVRDINLGRLDIALLPMLHNGLAQEYGLTLDNAL